MTDTELSPQEPMADVVLISSLGKIYCKLSFGIQILPKNMGAGVASCFWLKS
jgi:hypothetical protein